MPPKASNTTRRKGPTFNPPRPVKPAAEASAVTKRASGTTASRSAGASKAGPSGSHVRPAAAVISSDEEDEVIEDALADGDELMEDELSDEDRPQRGLAQDPIQPIPAPLLARLLHQNFEDENTQIQKGAMNLFGSYMSIFVREAIARAKDERNKVADRGGRSDRFLQVEDLEKLTPQLVLDF